MRDYSLLFGLAALGLIVGCQQNGRTASNGIDASLESPAQVPTMGKKVGPDKFPGDATK